MGILAFTAEKYTARKNFFVTKRVLRHIYCVQTMSNIQYEISFSELRCKEVVNACDGRKLGKIIDIVFAGDTGKIKGIVTPYLKRGLFGKGQEVFIPWHCVKKLGEDVIIVDINGADQLDRQSSSSVDCGCAEKPQDDNCTPNHPDMPNCDRRCEKCMLFDCEYRWKK